ncbi:hypothetical protein BH11PSE10_BH11PSE10_03990 [soil metagenome]
MAASDAQRRWQAACPNCGAPVEFASSASASAVCSFCRSTLLREGDALRKIGLSAELIEDYSPLQLGAAGRYAGAAFTIVGRLQFAYAEGTWNEWHALFDGAPDGQKSGWLSEDNGSFVFAFDAQTDERLPQAHELVLGAQQVLAGQAWSVAALTTAKLLAAQGELPRPPALGREFLVAELRNARDEVGSLDYSDPERPQWSLGRPVRIAELAMTGLRDDKQGRAISSRALPCPSCGAALVPKLGNTQSIVCGQCSAVVDISKGAGADLAFYAQQNGMEPQLPLGTTGLLAVEPGRPLRWQIVGYQERCDLPDGGEDSGADEQTFWREYLLFNQTEGFAFLVDTDEGWSVVRPLTGAPRTGAGGIEWQGQAYRRRFSYAAKVTYVLGEFYWKVEREARAQVTDYEAKTGRELLSSEQTGTELVWSQGRKLDAAEVARAFALPADKQAVLARDVSSFGAGGSGGLLRKIAIGIVIVVIIVLLLRACSGSDDCAQYRDSYGEASAEYAQCKRNSGGGRIYPGGGGSYGGGSYGGYSGGGGGHK